VILEIDENYQLAQDLYEESISSKGRSEQSLEAECLDRLCDAFKVFNKEGSKRKVAKSADSDQEDQ
jgi:hypothetical protein